MLGWLKRRFKARKALLVDDVKTPTPPPLSPSWSGTGERCGGLHKVLVSWGSCHCLQSFYSLLNGWMSAKEL